MQLVTTFTSVKVTTRNWINNTTYLGGKHSRKLDLRDKTAADMLFLYEKSSTSLVKIRLTYPMTLVRIIEVLEKS
jgi:hypothetical protein